MNKKRFAEALTKLNTYSLEGEGVNRLAYSNKEKNALKFLMDEFSKEGLEVYEDSAGNVIARRNGSNPDLNAVAVGSHIDTVYEAGGYDGTIGVIAGLEIIRFLNENDISTERAIEVIIFACEESARFGLSTIESKAMTGTLLMSDLEDLKDKNNVSFAAAIKKRNLRIENFLESSKEEKKIDYFIELHIEQGPVLENEQLDIGIVTDIAAPTRFQIEFLGQASHSGTTPMIYRKDAFTAASEFSLFLESMMAEEIEYNTVTTIGECIVKPGAMNVVPGNVEMKVDVRGVSVASINRVVSKIYSKLEEIEETRNVRSNTKVISQENPVSMSESLIEILEAKSVENEFTYKKMNSGAGHDAMNMASICPTAMIFVPSKDGISHNPKEYTSTDQIMKGVSLLKDAVIDLACVSGD